MIHAWVKKGECRFDQIWLMGFSDLTPVITVCSKKTVYSGPTVLGRGELPSKLLAELQAKHGPLKFRYSLV